MATQDEIHRDLYEKVNLNTIAVGSLTSEVRANNDHFEKILATTTQHFESMISMMERDMKRRHREVLGLVMFAFFCVGIIGYGAIGKDGLYTVRQTVPAIANGQSGVPIDDGRRGAK